MESFPIYASEVILMGASMENAATRPNEGAGHGRGEVPAHAGLLQLFRDMVRVRKFEERVRAAYLEGLIYGTTHLCIGQEAVCVGVTAALRADDYLTYTYRGHGVCIARGMSMAGAFAEIFGRRTGVSGGLGGSMHLTDSDLNLIGAAGIVGGGLPMAVGAALSAQLAGQGQVSVTFFGDGAANIGTFHESMNMAAVWKLPLLFVCENNYYGEFTRIDRTTPFEDLVRRGAAYAMNSVAVDGNDVSAVNAAATQALLRARDGQGPTFLECRTYRHSGHSRTDPGKYRPQAEVEAWLARDPLPQAERMLLAERACDRAAIEEIMVAVAAEVDAAASQAAAAAWPEPSDYLDCALVRS
jgi:pyruvate dehydrogenase E1 component alpha subunit